MDRRFKEIVQIVRIHIILEEKFPLVTETFLRETNPVLY